MADIGFRDRDPKWLANVKMISAVVGTVLAVGGLWAIASDYAPAHRGWVKEQVAQSKEQVAQAVTDVSRQSVTTQLQVNTLRRSNLQAEKARLTAQLQDNATAVVRTIIEDRLRAVEFELQEVQTERDSLKPVRP